MCADWMSNAPRNKTDDRVNNGHSSVIKILRMSCPFLAVGYFQYVYVPNLKDLLIVKGAVLQS